MHASRQQGSRDSFAANISAQQTRPAWPKFDDVVQVAAHQPGGLTVGSQAGVRQLGQRSRIEGFLHAARNTNFLF